MMRCRGILKGNRIDLDERPPLPDGIRVRVEVLPEAVSGRGSPAAVLRLAGTLSCEEAEAILRASAPCRQIDELLWKDQG